MDITLNQIESLISKYSNKFIIVYFRRNMAGSAVSRILGSHDEVYWNKKFSNNLDYEDPIRYPDSVEGFTVQYPHTVPFKEQHLACVHHYFSHPWGDSSENLLEYFRLVKQDKKILLRIHEEEIVNKFNNVQIIHCMGKRLNRSLPMHPNETLEDIAPIFKDNYYNLNVNSLFSKNYDNFIDEYTKLVNELDLTPRVNSVRSFILLWNEKQERLNKLLS